MFGMDEQLTQVIDTLRERTEKIGLYMVDASVATTSEELREAGTAGDVDIAKMMANGEANFAVFATFTLNKVAWSDRIQNPEKYDTDTQFKIMMPSEEELLAERYRDMYKNSGGDFNKVFGGDDDDQEDLTTE